MNGRGGYIKLFRKIMEKGFYKKPDFLALWVHLLLRANHKGIAVFWNGEEKIIERGQFITSRPKLAQETGIEDSKIERILKFFKSEHMIEQQSFSKFRLITILNYDEWQGDEQENEQQVNSKRTADEQQVNTNKNDKNPEKEEPPESPAALPPKKEKTKFNYEPKHLEVANYLKSAIKENLPYHNFAGENYLESWANEFRILEKKVPFEKIKFVLEWSQADEFWKKNILSGSTFREKFGRLEAESRKSSSPQKETQEQRTDRLNRENDERLRIERESRERKNV